MHLAWYVVLMPKGGKSVPFNIEKKKQKTKNKNKNKTQQQQQKRKKEKSVCQIKL